MYIILQHNSYGHILYIQNYIPKRNYHSVPYEQCQFAE